MANYIISIFKTNMPVIFSWGFYCPVAIENGLRFNVNGFKHKGKVEVHYDEGKDLFIVQILTFEDEIIKTINRVYFDQLIEIIDNQVELVENYDEAVRNEYKLDKDNNEE